MSPATFWLTLTIAALAWYSTVTVYVAIRGTGDIRGMLARLAKRQQHDDEPGPP